MIPTSLRIKWKWQHQIQVFPGTIAYFECKEWIKRDNSRFYFDAMIIIIVYFISKHGWKTTAMLFSKAFNKGLYLSL